MKIKHYILIIFLSVVNIFVSQYVILLPFTFLGQGAVLLLMFGKVINFGLFSVTLVHVILLLIEIILASLIVSAFMRRSTNISFSKRFVIISIIFFISYMAAATLPAFYSQKKYESKHPVVTEEKNYDFTRPFSITERPIVSIEYDFKDNEIIWVEQTKKYPVYPNNVWDILLFKFDLNSGKGITTNLTNLKENAVQAAIIGDNDTLFFTESDQNFGSTLYSYNIQTKEKKKIAAGVQHIYGIYNSKLLVDVSDFGNYSISIIDIKNGDKKPVQFTNNSPISGSPKVFGSYATYINENTLWTYDIEHNTFNKEIIPDLDLKVEYQQPFIFGLGDTWVGYMINKSGSLRIYNRLTKQVLNLDQDVPNNGGSVNFIDMYPLPVLKNSSLFYVKNTSLVRLNLDTKKEDVLISDFTPKNTEFDIEGNYMLRFMNAPDDEFGGQQKELYLYPLSSN